MAAGQCVCECVCVRGDGFIGLLMQICPHKLTLKGTAGTESRSRLAHLLFDLSSPTTTETVSTGSGRPWTCFHNTHSLWSPLARARPVSLDGSGQHPGRKSVHSLHQSFLSLDLLSSSSSLLFLHMLSLRFFTFQQIVKLFWRKVATL